MGLADVNELLDVLSSVATILSIIIGGIWVYMRFIRQQEKYPNIDFTVDIQIIGKQGNDWVVELIAVIENKGKAQHKMEEFSFDLRAIKQEENLETSEKWGGQVDFKHLIAEGSFLPERFKFFFIDPGTMAKYSFVTKVPDNHAFIILHSQFKYTNRNDYGHTAEKTINLQ